MEYALIISVSENTVSLKYNFEIFARKMKTTNNTIISKTKMSKREITVRQ